MTPSQIEKIIVKACEEHDLDCHTRTIRGKRDAGTRAERMAMEITEADELTVKNSYMYCDSLDMCFFINERGKPCVTYTGYAAVDYPDINAGKLIAAFSKANEVLQTMSKLVKEAEQ